MIRVKFYKDITATIDRHSRFDSSDFKVEPKKEPRSEYTVLTVYYSIEPKYKIIFKIPSTTTIDAGSYSPYYAFSGTVSPGPLAYEETFSFKGEDGVFDRISKWLDCIWEELSSNPIVKQVEKQQNQINDIFEKFETIKDEFFTDEEAFDLKTRLDELEETLKNQIIKNKEDKSSFESQVAKLHTDIDTLKQTVQSFKKKGWLKSFTGKVFKWTQDSDNRKTLIEGYDLLREFLPEEIKTSLP